MAYTFGAATGDDITWTIGQSIGATAISSLVCGWWYPTTLTATRGLWSAGNVNGAEIDTTTDELRLRNDATTDGQWTTAGVDLAVDTWKFIAILTTNNNTGALTAWRVWAGDLTTPPIEATVTVATARVGNSTGSTSFYVGNKGTGTLAFQGDIAEVVVISSGNSAGVTSNPFSIASNGAISQAEADYTLERFVRPIWTGNVDQVTFQALKGAQATAVYYWSGLALSDVHSTAANSASPTRLSPTVSGATVSARHAPRSLSNWQLLPDAPRR